MSSLKKIDNQNHKPLSKKKIPLQCKQSLLYLSLVKWFRNILVIFFFFSYSSATCLKFIMKLQNAVEFGTSRVEFSEFQVPNLMWQFYIWLVRDIWHGQFSTLSAIFTFEFLKLIRNWQCQIHTLPHCHSSMSSPYHLVVALHSAPAPTAKHSLV